MNTRNIFATHQFTNLQDAKFSVSDYSRMKFGDDNIAKKFGYELADAFFKSNMALVVGQQLVVFASPYNYVKNAATIMTQHFIDRLNMLCVIHGGHSVEYSVIHRKISYVNDYGFLGADERKKLIDGDSFSINKHFVCDKTLLFIDDVRITGTHEHKLVELLEREHIELKNAYFLYHANMVSNEIHPGIEAELNFASVKSTQDFIDISNNTQHHMIIRPIKYMLSRSVDDLADMLLQMRTTAIVNAYYGALAEGYYKVPSYHATFGLLKMVAEKIVKVGEVV